MARIVGEIIIGGPAEEEFDFEADQRNEPRYNSRMARADEVSDGPVGKGTVFRSSAKSMGRTAEMRGELTGDLGEHEAVPGKPRNHGHDNSVETWLMRRDQWKKV